MADSFFFFSSREGCGSLGRKHAPVVEGLGLGRIQVWIIPSICWVTSSLIPSRAWPAPAEPLQEASGTGLAAGDSGVALATEGAEGWQSASTVPGVQ